MSGKKRTGRAAAKSSRGRGPRVRQGRTHPVGPSALLNSIRSALAHEHPLALLAAASTILTVIDPRQSDQFGRPGTGGPSESEMLESLLGVDVLETSALLATIAVLKEDELLRARIRRELARRQHRLPDWLQSLPAPEVYRTSELSHVLGDGDNVMLGARLPGGHELTAVVYIDHNMGTLVKDSFVLDQPIQDVVTRFRQLVDDPDSRIEDIPAGDARVRVTEAIDLAAHTYPPFETDTWPACRPLVEWIARSLPGGGQGYTVAEWDPQQLGAIAERFRASRFGPGFRDRNSSELLDLLLSFGSGYGQADPLRWSPVVVELFLGDWVPRKVMAPAEFLAGMPALLRAFIRFAHDERGIRSSLTKDTLAAVGVHEPEYRRAIRTSGPGLRAGLPPDLLAVLGGMDPFGAGGPASSAGIGLAPAESGGIGGFGFVRPETSWESAALAELARTLGGEDVLDELNTDPLPDEPFVATGLEPDIMPEVHRVLALSDRAADAMFDVEFRTAARRLLAVVASGDPEIFRRGSRPEWSAAAIGWVIARNNRLFDHGSVRDFMAHFGLKGTASQRAIPMLKAGGFSSDTGWVNLRSTGYLTSARRAALIAQRDRLRGRA